MSESSTESLVIIILLNWNSLEDTLRCIDSIFKSTYPHFEIIVVDNGSDVNPEDTLDAAYPGVQVIRNSENRGFTGGNNQGIRLALEKNADYIWLLNNDTTVSPDTLRELVRAAETFPEAGLLSPVVYVQDHPEALAIHSTTEFEYNGIKQGNRNTLLYKNIGVDGLKTGHIEESGYHLVATAKRDGQRMIAVVMGCDKYKKRAPEAQKLLEYGFKNFTTLEVVKKGATFGPLKVKRGKLDQVSLAASEDVRVTVARGKESTVTTAPELPQFVVAPIQKGQAIAKVSVRNEGKVVKEVGLLASSGVEKTLIPPWPVLAGIGVGVVLLGIIGLWFVRRPKGKKM